MKPPVFGLIVVGDEILSGRRSDKHLGRCIEILAAHGQSLGWAQYVGDAPERITAVLRSAFASGDAVFCTGGIGSTPDDHTRQCAAAALNSIKKCLSFILNYPILYHIFFNFSVF